ncbi:MAG TPA: hypothetical protein VGA61_01095 [Anaerolineae bacterium]
MKQVAGWSFLAVVGLTLVILGFQGNLGTALACLFCPSQVTVTQG